MQWVKGIKEFFTDSTRRKWFWPGLSFFILLLLLGGSFLPTQVDFTVGEIAPENIEAPHNMVLIDEEKTAELREEKAQQVPNVIEEDEGALNRMKSDINLFFNAFKHDEAMYPNGAWRWEGFEPQEIRFWSNIERERLESLQEKLKTILTRRLEQGLRSTHLDEARENVADEIRALDLGAREEEHLIALAEEFLRPNLVLNVEETARRREEARASAPPVTRTIRQGEIIIEQGQVITEDDLELLGEMGLFQPELDPLYFLGVGGLLVLIFLGNYRFLLNFHPRILQRENQMVLISFLPVFMVILAQATNYLPVVYPGYLFPLAVGSILLAVLLQARVAIFFTFSLAILCFLVLQGGLPEITVGLVGGISGVYSVARVTQRRDFVRAGVIVGVFCAIAILTLSLLENITEPHRLLFLGGLGLANGILAAVLINGLLPLLENYLGMSSAVRLLELSNPNQPLLKKLLMEAPGTYHHSVIVGNLAEAAAERLGADALLARVGAYYHDVGKIKRPYFFSENLLGDENPHDKLNPSLSALIIKSHVKDGVEMGKRHKLPEPIVDIIQQHHGTSLISYFYQESLQRGENDSTNFSYDGPKPYSREAALILLADVVEAAVRSRAAERENPQALAAMIRELIKEKLEIGQLDDSYLTLRDLEPIQDCFTRILMGIYHKRIEYPDYGEIREASADEI